MSAKYDELCKSVKHMLDVHIESALTLITLLKSVSLEELEKSGHRTTPTQHEVETGAWEKKLFEHLPWSYNVSTCNRSNAFRHPLRVAEDQLRRAQVALGTLVPVGSAFTSEQTKNSAREGDSYDYASMDDDGPDRMEEGDH